MGTEVREISQELEARVEALGFELVEAEWAGSAKRPILRLRVDRPDAVSGESGITLDECAQVSRGLEPWLDEHPAMAERYVLEVSSPGVNRPLVRERDFRRFAGEYVAVRGKDVLAGRARRLEGTLLGAGVDEEGAATIRLRLNSGEEVEVPWVEVTRAHLVYRWD